MKPDKSNLNLIAEMNRILSSAILACALLLLLVLLEPPITILAWLLFGAGVLSLLHTCFASHFILKQLKSNHHTSN